MKFFVKEKESCRKSEYPCFSTRMKSGKKKDSDSCFDVTMGSYGDAELCEFIDIYSLSQLYNIISKNDYGLQRNDGLIIQKCINGRQINQLRKKVIKIFKKIGFKIDIETYLKIVNFLDMTFNWINGSYKPSKKTNDTQLHITKVKTIHNR